MVSSSSPGGKLLRSSLHLFRLAVAQRDYLSMPKIRQIKKMPQRLYTGIRKTYSTETATYGFSLVNVLCSSKSIVGWQLPQQVFTGHVPNRQQQSTEGSTRSREKVSHRNRDVMKSAKIHLRRIQILQIGSIWICCMIKVSPYRLNTESDQNEIHILIQHNQVFNPLDFGFVKN